MKKKIIIGLTVFSLIFLLTAIYTITTIEHATTKMDDLIKLHQVEILREHLLIQIQRAQSDLYVAAIDHMRPAESVKERVQSVYEIASTCFECHHSDAVAAKLNRLKQKIVEYQRELNVILAHKAGRIPVGRGDAVYALGAELIFEVDSMSRMANRKLEERTLAAFTEIARTKSMLYVLIVVVPLAAIAVSALFIRSFTRPVNELLTATRKLKSGALEYRIEGLQDEFREVAASFNDMAHALREGRLRMQWAEQLVVLGEMVGGLAHEIKNPLAGIKASVDVLSCDPTLSLENRIVATKVAEQIKRIESLLKNVLNLARPPKPQLARVDVNEVFEATIGLAERHPAFAGRKSRPVAILKDFDPHVPETMADPLQLQQVFLNLLLNAADSITNEGSIIVRTSYQEAEGLVQIKVIDTGKGVNETIVGKIFQPFFTTKPNGTGLGLAISKGLVEQHGGTITVQNNTDHGASFTITMPVRSFEEVVNA